VVAAAFRTAAAMSPLPWHEWRAGSRPALTVAG